MTSNFAPLNLIDDLRQLFALFRLTGPGGAVLASVLSPYYLGDLRYRWWWRNAARLAREGRYAVPGAQALIWRRRLKDFATQCTPHFVLERVFPGSTPACASRAQAAAATQHLPVHVSVVSQDAPDGGAARSALRGELGVHRLETARGMVGALALRSLVRGLCEAHAPCLVCKQAGGVRQSARIAHGAPTNAAGGPIGELPHRRPHRGHARHRRLQQRDRSGLVARGEHLQIRGFHERAQGALRQEAVELHLRCEAELARQCLYLPVQCVLTDHIETEVDPASRKRRSARSNVDWSFTRFRLAT